MVSRRKILSRSRDDLTADEPEEDIWHHKEKLYKEHIQEVLDKWTQIDDEIWAKIIVFERNRRVAKAYARVPVLTVNGSEDGFDGMKIGLCGFDNPMRDSKTAELKRHIGQGVKIKMDDAGNILIRRYSKNNVYIKSTATAPNEETAIGNDVLKAPNQCLEIEKVYKVFDMKKFQSNVNRELSRSYPDRRRLETQCLSVIGFVKAENDILECPIWVMIVNVVAMDMLKSKLPPVQRAVDIKNRPKIPIPDEDPYSEAGNSASSSGSSGLGGSSAERIAVTAVRDQLILKSQQNGQKRSDKPPKLPPRDNMYHPDKPKLLRPDYDDIEEETRMKLMQRGKSDKGKNKEQYDDPYYCGMRARVPNFGKVNVKSNGTLGEKKPSIFSKVASKLKDKDPASKQRPSVAQLPHPASFSTLYQLHQMQNGTINHPNHNSKNGIFQRHNSQPEPYIWHAKSYESGIDTEYESQYQIYGRLPNPGRGYIQQPPRGMYVGEWE
ncbi:unnamed protein product [Diamesa serratosioi]